MDGQSCIGPVPSRPWSRNEVLTLAAILGVGALLRIASAVAIPSPLESDYLGYWTIANNLYAGHGLIGTNGQPTAFLSVGYPLFLFGVFAVLGPTIAVVKAANICLGVAAIFLLYIAARRLFESRSIAALAALLFATYLESIAYTTYVAKENLMVFLMMAQLALAVTCGDGRWRYLNPILFGIATGCLAVVGNAGLALVPALLLQIFLASGSIARTSRYLVIAAIAGGIVVAPLLWRNHQVFGAYVLNNNGGVNLYVGNNPRATPYFSLIADTPIGDQWHTLRAQLGEHGTDVMLRELAIQHIVQNPGTTMQLALRKAVAFWWPPVHSGKYQEGAAEKFIRLAWLIEFCAICALFLTATIRYGRTFSRQFVVLWLLVAGYTAVHMIFYVIYRYRLPIMPVLCIGGGLGAQMILSWMSDRGFLGAQARRWAAAN